jgi:hypothetical protein
VSHLPNFPNPIDFWHMGLNFKFHLPSSSLGFIEIQISLNLPLADFHRA